MQRVWDPCSHEAAHSSGVAQASKNSLKVPESQRRWPINVVRYSSDNILTSQTMHTARAAMR